MLGAQRPLISRKCMQKCEFNRESKCSLGGSSFFLILDWMFIFETKVNYIKNRVAMRLMCTVASEMLFAASA